MDRVGVAVSTVGAMALTDGTHLDELVRKSERRGASFYRLEEQMPISIMKDLLANPGSGDYL